MGAQTQTAHSAVCATPAHFFALQISLAINFSPFFS
jgi:hypothetical protein